MIEITVGSETHVSPRDPRGIAISTRINPNLTEAVELWGDLVSLWRLHDLIGDAIADLESRQPAPVPVAADAGGWGSRLD